MTSASITTSGVKGAVLVIAIAWATIRNILNNGNATYNITTYAK